MAAKGCAFRVSQDIAEKKIGLNMTANEINNSVTYLSGKTAYQGGPVVNTSNMYVGDMDQVVNNAFAKLGHPEITARVGWGSEGKQPSFQIMRGITPSGTHFRLGDGNGNQIFDPAPPGIHILGNSNMPVYLFENGK